MPDDSLLRPDFEAHLQSLQGQLEDKRSKIARLDSAEARLRRAEASLAKKEQAMEDADEAKKALEEVRATMVPNTVAEPQEEEETVLKLGLADVHDLHNLLHNLQARIHNSSEAERPAKKSRDNTGVGTAQPRTTTRFCTERWATWVPSCKPTNHSRRRARLPLRPRKLPRCQDRWAICLGEGRRQGARLPVAG